jgi:DnaJ-domain-containing protein 1
MKSHQSGQESMASQPPKSFAALLWAAVRIGARAIWRSNANPARSFVQRQQALSVLGLPPNATQQQIKRRYRSLAKRYHPDRGGDQRQMQRIIAAYEFLMREQTAKRQSS